MFKHKFLNTMISILMITSLLLGGVAPVYARAQDTQTLPAQKAVPSGPTDETKVPHYFGPYPNWALSPLTLPNATVEITGTGGTGATAVAVVDPVSHGIASIQVTSPGSGYTTATVAINGGTPGGATADATINTSGVVSAVNITVQGAGYTSPQVSFSGGGTTAQATGTAYGSVDAIAITSGGSGYTMPTVDFNWPDAPDGVIAKGHVPMIANGDPVDGMVGGVITEVWIDEPGSGYLTAPEVAIHNGTLFDPIPGATPAVLTTTLKVTSVTIDTFGSGYTSAPDVTFSDLTGSGINAAGTAVVDVGGVTSINVTNAGSGYLIVGMRKFIDALPGLCMPPACPTTGKYIPLAVPEVKTYNGVVADEYEIGLVQYRTSFSSDLPPTLVRGYVQLETAANAGISQHYPLTNELLDGTQVPVMKSDGTTQWLAVTPPQWLGPTIGATKDKPVRIVFRNLLPKGSDGDLFLPTDSSLMGSGMGPMDMGAPAEAGTVMDEVRNPICSDNPQATDAMGMGLCFQQNRATLHLHGGTTPWISDGTAHQWITPKDETTPWPQGVGVQNVPDMTATGEHPAGCDSADDGCMTFYYTNQQSARLLFYHDHAWGITRLNVYAGEAAGYLIGDDTETALLTSGTIPADQIPLVIQDRTFVPDAAQLALQDPTWDVARWGTKGSFWYHHVYMPAQNPGDPSGMSAYGRWMYGPWFWPPAADTMYGPIDNPYYNMDPATNFTTSLAIPCNIDDPATWQYQTDPFCEPQQIPGTPNISVGMEQFNDTPIVNGVAYPEVTLEPKSYRFRMLNAANDRFFNFQWYIADPTQGSGLTEVALNPLELAAAQTDPNVSPTPVQGAATAGPDWIQIGSEGGFLPAPVVVDGQQPTTWITDPTRFDVGNVDKHSLLLAPAERADVIVDFSKFAGKTLILYNDAPAAFPARVPTYDYYTGAPDLSPNGAPTILPGYGPNTRTIMQVTIAGTAAPAFNLTKLQNAFKHKVNGTGVFESGQHPIIVGQSAYNSAYGTSFAASSNCNAPGSTVQRCDGLVRVNDTMSFGFNTLRAPTVKMTIPLQPKAIHDEMNSTTFDEYGRMQANLGVEAQPPTPGAQNVTLYPFVNPATELIDATNLPKGDINVTAIADAGDGTQIWRITHNGVDTHPIHFHLYDVQVVNRVTWDNIIIPTEPGELGWKDTVRISPLEDTIVALRPIIPTLPWEIPNSIRNLNPMMPTGSTAMFNNIDPQGNPTANILNQLVNFGWEYVYHCHILSHEEMDMMRPVLVAVPPVKPDGLVGTINGPNEIGLVWNDNSIAETSYVVQRETNGSGIWENVGTLQSPLDVVNGTGIRTFTDTSALNTTSVAYAYRILALNTLGYGAEFPTMTVQSMSDVYIVTDSFTVSGALGLNGAGASVAFTGGTPVTAGVTGDYSFKVPSGWTGTITPSKTGYTFADTVLGLSSITVSTGLTGDLPGQDFITTPNTFTLTYTAGLNGSITGTTPQTVNYNTNGTTVTAVPANGYHFVNWSDSSTANPRTDTNVTANISVTANFAIDTFALTYTAGPNGSITGTTPQTVNSGADGIAVSTVPNLGYHFVDWSDGSTANPRTDTNVTANISVTANFAIDITVSGTLGTPGVTVAYSGTTSGSATITGSSYSFPVPSGWTGTITPSKTGYTFTPASIVVATPVIANLPNQDFNATLNTYSVYGTLGTTGATVAFSGTTSGSATIIGSSNYFFTVPYGWTGTVTPAKAGYGFSPANRTYTNVTANQSAQNYTTILGPGIYDDTDPNWSYTGSWTAYTGSGPYNNTLHYTSTVGDAASFTFSGTQFILTYTQSAARGTIDVYVDGSKVSTINANGSTQWRKTYTSPVFSAGTHVVQFRHAGGSYIDVDAIQILTTATPGAGVYDDTHFNWSYIGSWTAYTGSGPYNNTLHYTPTVGDAASFTFSGTQFILTYTQSAARGTIDVYVDGSKVSSINANGAVQWKKMYVSPIFPAGTHVVQFRHAGGSFIDVDAIQILAATAPGASVYDDTDVNWFYTGSWTAYTGSGPYNNTLHYTSTVGDAASFTFSGTQFMLTYTQSAARGTIDVYVDGSKVNTINANGSTQWRKTYTSPVFSAGTHVVQFRHAGGGGGFIDVDAIQIQ